MTAGPFPLEALLKLRARVREQRQHQLARGLDRLRRTEERADEAERALTEHAELLKHSRQGATSMGGLTAAALQTRDRYLARLEQERGPLDQARLRARKARDEQRAAVERLRAELAQAEAELQAVQKNFEAWDKARRRAEVQRAEQELEDHTHRT